MPRDALVGISREIVRCRLCPRLVAFREEVARRKRRAYADQRYWGRPVPGFGDPRAWLALVGLAPGAHGANRTGRVFTGDRSGDFLFAALHRAGLSNQGTATSSSDGLVLRGAYILLTARCAPPDNRPSPEELARCAPFLDAELDLLKGCRVVLALGAIAFDAYLGYLARRGRPVRPKPKFSHGLEVGASPALLASYHVSQQNTQTGRLTAAMFDAILERARKLGDA
jgi:uracil-DNA glycosylase